MKRKNVSTILILPLQQLSGNHEEMQSNFQPTSRELHTGPYKYGNCIVTTTS